MKFIRYLSLVLVLFLIVGGTVACRDANEDEIIKNNQSTQFTTASRTEKTTVRTRVIEHTIPDPEVTALGSFVYNIAVVKFGKVLSDKTYTMQNGSYVGVEYTLETFFASTCNEYGRKYKHEISKRKYIYFPADAVDLITEGESCLVFLFVRDIMESVENQQGSIESLPVVGMQIFRDKDLNKTTLLLPFRDGKLTIPEYVYQTDATGEYVYYEIGHFMRGNQKIADQNLNVPAFATGATVADLELFFSMKYVK